MKAPRFLRVAALTGLSVILVSGLVLTPQSATAANFPPITPNIPPTAPPAVNVLPSTIKGSMPLVGGTVQQNVLATYLYKFSKSPLFWAAAARVQAGTATPAQQTLVTQSQQQHRIPAQKFQNLSRIVGTGTTVLSGYQMGTMLGGGVLDVVGFDRTGAVCYNTSGLGQVMVEILTGVSCAEFNEFADGYQANQGLVGGLSIGPICNGSKCFSYAGVLGLDAAANKSTYWCMSGNAVPVDFGNNISYLTSRDSTWRATSLSNVNSNNWMRNGACGSGGSGAVGGLWIRSSLNNTTVPDSLLGLRYNGITHDVQETTTNPSRTLKCVIATTGGTYTAFTNPYTEADGVLPTPVCPNVPEGEDLLSTTIYEEYDGKSIELWKQNTTPEYQQHQELYPECSTGMCMLDLRKDGVSCFVNVTLCESWFENPDKTGMECRYGSKVVDLAECTLYGPTFKPQPNGNYYANPDNGLEGLPAPPGSPNPGTGPQTFGTTIQDPEKARNCFPTGWDVFNPIMWVQKPVQCAFEWAFVPRPSFVNSQGVALNNSVQTSILGSLTSLQIAFVSPFQIASSGCQGPPFRVDIDLFDGAGMDETYYPLSACTGVMSTVAHFFNLASSGIVYIGAGLASIRYFAGIFGFFGFSKPEKTESSVKFK